MVNAASSFHSFKKGQFALEDIFSYIGYFISILIIIVVLSLPSCLTGIHSDKTEESIKAKAGAAALVKGNAQLSSYLRTQMPEKDKLFDKLTWVKQHAKYEFAKGLDVEGAERFLKRHPEVYLKKDYAEFVRSLQAIHLTNADEMDDAGMTFKVVTAAMFLRGISDKKKEGGYLYYLLPIGVDFQNAEAGQPSAISDYELYAGGMLPREIFFKKPVQAIQVIPLTDSTLAKVELTYYPELASWLPQP